MPDQDLVKTGIRGLDVVLPGGIPRGNVIVVEGAAGTGKTTLGLEFVYRGAREFDEPGLVVLFEVAPDKLIRDAAGFGWNLPELERAGRLRIIFTTREVFYREMQQSDSLLLDEARQIGARRVFIDGLPHTPEVNGIRDPREQFHVLAEGLHRERLTALMTLDVLAQEEARLATMVPEELVADTIILLRREPMSRAVQRSLEVVKSRGQDYQMGRHSFRILDGRGLEVFRRVQAPRGLSRDRAAAFDPTTRVTTGVPGLDEIVNGGYFLGSTTLVVGISGAGKSVMALQYMAEGARRGERGLMLTLDEPTPQVLRNAVSLGLDLPGAVERGLVEVWYDPPQEIDVDRHFHDIEERVQRLKPRRVVIDSLSTYGSSLGSEGRAFRDFFHALVALMKEHQIAAVYNHENAQFLGMSSMMGDFSLSSLVDNILLLNWVELGDTFRLGLTVAKMRANPTIHVTREVEVVGGVGMQVLPRDTGTMLPAIAFAGHSGLVSRAPDRRRRDAPGGG
jgi:circadian clock protein KaiC